MHSKCGADGPSSIFNRPAFARLAIASSAFSKPRFAELPHLHPPCRLPLRVEQTAADHDGGFCGPEDIPNE
jgi:hypothetical protein